MKNTQKKLDDLKGEKGGYEAEQKLIQNKS